ncbi:ATP-binding protein [Nocardiopsis sp. ATB16-24]|uniref:ATP-binding protein n=1 Tax=Nocardiopsis sp. ATB16-24 TaxID=3019555 RepID=UPI0025533040|nr:ATP-binding protein [Nocardiopsis sp. ATB16-24]
MNAELVSSDIASEVSWSRRSLTQASHTLLGGWWHEPLGRVALGGSARTPNAAGWAFASVPGSVREAREAAARALREWGRPDVMEDVRLIVSELVGNACRHARAETAEPGTERVVVQLRHLGMRGGVVCMVADSSEKAPVRMEAHHFAESGRGLGLVSAFSSEWGWKTLPGRGKIVWAICGGKD